VTDTCIFTGDTLFLDDGGAGRDDLPGGDAGDHWESLEKIKTLPGHLMVYPAHEYRDRKSTTLGVQKGRNPHLKARTKNEFIRYIDDLRLGPAEWMKDVLKANFACAREPGAVWIPADLPACEIKGTMAHTANDIEVAAITVEQLQQMLHSSSPPILLDVRESAELKRDLGHLPSIVHIPIGSLSGRLTELNDYKNRKIVTVCRSGGRAHTAARILVQAGFSDVNLLKGGMTAWRNA